METVCLEHQCNNTISHLKYNFKNCINKTNSYSSDILQKNKKNCYLFARFSVFHVSPVCYNPLTHTYIYIYIYIYIYVIHFLYSIYCGPLTVLLIKSFT